MDFIGCQYDYLTVKRASWYVFSSPTQICEKGNYWDNLRDAKGQTITVHSSHLTRVYSRALAFAKSRSACSLLPSI